MNITNLPSDIFYIIGEYVNINNLLNISKKMDDIKKIQINILSVVRRNVWYCNVLCYIL